MKKNIGLGLILLLLSLLLIIDIGVGYSYDFDGKTLTVREDLIGLSVRENALPASDILGVALQYGSRKGIFDIGKSYSVAVIGKKARYLSLEFVTEKEALKFKEGLDQAMQPPIGSFHGKYRLVDWFSALFLLASIALVISFRRR